MSHCDDDASISHNNENRISLLTSPPFKGYREKSIASGTRKETQQTRCGEESESSSLPAATLRRRLSRSLATRGYSQSITTLITFLSGCAHSLFGEPVYIIKNSDEKFELFTY